MQRPLTEAVKQTSILVKTGVAVYIDSKLLFSKEFLTTGGLHSLFLAYRPQSS